MSDIEERLLGIECTLESIDRFLSESIVPADLTGPMNEVPDKIEPLDDRCPRCIFRLSISEDNWNEPEGRHWLSCGACGRDDLQKYPHKHLAFIRKGEPPLPEKERDRGKLSRRHLDCHVDAAGLCPRELE